MELKTIRNKISIMTKQIRRIEGTEMDHRGHGELYEAKYLKTKRELDDINLQIAELKKEQLENDISFTIGTSEEDL